MKRGLVTTAGLVAAAMALSGCSLGGWVYNADLPGGAKLGNDPIKLTADFTDVLDLVPQSNVEVDNVAVGRVSSIALAPDGHSAVVTLLVNRSAELPQGTTARLEQTSLLGEKYVALVPPSGASAAAAPPLQDGATLPLASTSEAVDVEEVLGALSLVLNGGGIGQFQEISRELQKVGDGRTGKIRDFLTQVNRLVDTLNTRRTAITSALDGLDKLSKSLNGEDDKIATALDGLSPGMKVLAQQRPQLVAMLQALDKLSKVTVTTLDRSQKDIVADFKSLDPILTQLAAAGQNLPDSLQILLTYPFPDSVLGAIQGDYLNVFMTTNFRTLPQGCAEEGCAWPQVDGSASVAPQSRGLPPSTPASATPPTLLPPTDSPMPGAASSSVPSKSILPSPATGSTPSGPPSATGSPSSAGPTTGTSDPSISAPATQSPTADGSTSDAPTSEGE